MKTDGKSLRLRKFGLCIYFAAAMIIVFMKLRWDTAHGNTAAGADDHVRQETCGTYRENA